MLIKGLTNLLKFILLDCYFFLSLFQGIHNFGFSLSGLLDNVFQLIRSFWCLYFSNFFFYACCMFELNICFFIDCSKHFSCNIILLFYQWIVFKFHSMKLFLQLLNFWLSNIWIKCFLHIFLKLIFSFP